MQALRSSHQDKAMIVFHLFKLGKAIVNAVWDVLFCVKRKWPK
jgi:hypothetical protein